MYNHVMTGEFLESTGRKVSSFLTKRIGVLDTPRITVDSRPTSRTGRKATIKIEVEVPPYIKVEDKNAVFRLTRNTTATPGNTYQVDRTGGSYSHLYHEVVRDRDNFIKEKGFQGVSREVASDIFDTERPKEKKVLVRHPTIGEINPPVIRLQEEDTGQRNEEVNWEDSEEFFSCDGGSPLLNGCFSPSRFLE